MSDVEISPSILSADFGYLMRDIREVEPLCRFLHIDVMDGHFVPNFTMGLPVIRSIRKYTDMIFDCHLMISEPERYIKNFADCGCDYITFHIECTEDAAGLCGKIRSLGKKAGIAIHPDTPVEEILPFIGYADLILVMSVRPGFGGQSYMESATDRIRIIRNELDKISSDAILSVDGGINRNTAKTAYDAGARLLVAGYAVFSEEDKAGAVKDLVRCALQ